MASPEHRLVTPSLPALLQTITMFDNTTAFDNITGNMTGNNTALEESSNGVMKTPWLRGMFVFFYCVIFLLGISGNSLVVYVVVRNKSMQTITNIFITNLAVSDIMMCSLSVPFTPLSAFLPSWVFGDALCHILPMVLMVSVYVSTLTSTAIAIDRYFVIVHPFKPRMKVFVCVLLIIAIWIISISISLPLAIYQRVFYNEEEQAYACYEHWPGKIPRQFFTVTSMILQYIYPCSIITFCYYRVSMVLRDRARHKIGSSSKNPEKDELDLKRKRRTNKMLIAMVAIFVVCWLPLNIAHITSEFHGEIDKWKYYEFVFFIAHVIAMSSTIYNPFLYAWMNENFKKEFKAVLPCLSFGGPSKTNGSIYTSVGPQSQWNKRPSNATTVKASPITTTTYECDSETVNLNMAPASEC